MRQCWLVMGFYRPVNRNRSPGRSDSLISKCTFKTDSHNIMSALSKVKYTKPVRTQLKHIYIHHHTFSKSKTFQYCSSRLGHAGFVIVPSDFRYPIKKKKEIQSPKHSEHIPDSQSNNIIHIRGNGSFKQS